MYKQKVILVCCCVLFCLSIHGMGLAATINSNSCSQAHVKEAIDSANNGDIVSIPVGTCTWGSSVSIPDTKKITLVGQGYDRTVITMDGGSLLPGKSSSRITQIGFVMDSGYSIITVNGKDWRVDHCKFTNNQTTNNYAIVASGLNETVSPAGLVDNNIFNNCKVLATGMGNFNTSSAQWAAPLGLGTDDAVYVEDCTFNYDGRGNCMDSNRGGKYVFRYNTVIQSRIEAHSLQSDVERATRKWEIYNNHITSTSAMWGPFLIRGGTGVIFNNTVAGPWSDKNIILDNVRSFKSVGTAGKCDGSSAWDGNQPGENGYPCRDQIGRSTDQSLWTTANPYPPQALDPAYFWNNKYSDGSDIGVTLANGSEVHIKQDRDYFLNMSKPGYTPYPYPHPLTSSPPARNLRISN
jgi:hypothetical protein